MRKTFKFFRDVIMSLKEVLQKDWISAMKSKDSFRASVITMVRSSILKEEKDKKIELDDEAVIAVLSREVKQRKEAIQEFEKGKRHDLVEQNNKEIEILLEYLPQQLTEEEISEIIKNAVYEIGAVGIRDMGKVMTAIMPKVKGRADGKLVSDLVKLHLK